MPTALTALLEAALDRWLAAGPPSARLRLAGRSIAVTIEPPGLGLVFLGAADRIQVLGELEGEEPDCSVSGSPLALAAALSRGDRSGIVIRGDATVLGDLQRALAGVSFDWAGWFESLAGAGSAGPLLRAGETARARVERFFRRGEADLSGYLQEEIRWLPASGEFDAFSIDLADLRDDVARLEARLERLEDPRVARDGGTGSSGPG
ncbi:Sterol-binding domain protein [Thioalkalivibrio nitratireducens DSM 14787]|uniref:Ubiquinone biosynthesis accessory factor UbiJ n=2 Tax=Thioalkalivibrio nitratireducens TaxID=186931 RepID=L0DTV5_THIND|nr:Sterol-binding domain protein [Thioalkalivibrio nitratireducens DSM 14787]